MREEIEELVGIVKHSWGAYGQSESVEQVLNVRDVYERMGASIYRVRLVFTSFLECLSGELQKLEQAVKSDGPGEVQDAAHALRGLLLEVSAEGPAAVALRLESLAIDSAHSERAQLVAQVSSQAGNLARLVNDVLVRTAELDRGSR